MIPVSRRCSGLKRNLRELFRTVPLTQKKDVYRTSLRGGHTTRLNWRCKKQGSTVEAYDCPMLEFFAHQLPLLLFSLFFSLCFSFSFLFSPQFKFCSGKSGPSPFSVWGLRNLQPTCGVAAVLVLVPLAGVNSGCPMSLQQDLWAGRFAWELAATLNGISRTTWMEIILFNFLGFLQRCLLYKHDHRPQHIVPGRQQLEGAVMYLAEEGITSH